MSPEPETAREELPPFAYEVLLCSDFEGVLEASGTTASREAVVQAALERGRVLLQARGGAGKSTTLKRIAEAARSEGVRVVELWAVEWAKHAAQPPGEPSSADLLNAMAHASSPPTAMSELADGQPSLLLVDGLNELQTSHAHAILAAANTLATRYPQLGIMIADRLARRSIDEISWQLATLTPVPLWQVRDVLGASYREETETLFSNPYFLERARRDPMSAATHRSFFSAQLKIADHQLAKLARAVNLAYRERGNRLVNLNWLGEQVGSSIVDRLMEAGVLEMVEEPDARFVHHLISDFLAALDIADDPSRWNRAEFDVLTFKASSFDALPMVLDEVLNDNADLFARRLYDWNFYAAAYVIAEDEERSHRITTELKTAVLAMLAERRFDQLQATARQVSDALRLQKSAIAKALLTASDLETIIDIVEGLDISEPWFRQWRQLFGIRSGRDARADEVSLIRDADSVLGWTAANVLKRLTLDSDVVASLATLLEDVSPTIRWRAAHVLGAARTASAAEALDHCARGDEDLWVRYGAIRSLIEMAAGCGPEMRAQIFERLGQIAHEINETSQLTNEVARALTVTAPPANWSEDAGLLLECLWADAGSIEMQDRWRDVSARLRLSEPVGA